MVAWGGSTRCRAFRLGCRAPSIGASSCLRIPRGFGGTERAARVRLPESFPARCGQLRRDAERAIPIHAIPPACFEKTVESRRGALVEGGGSCSLRRLSPSCRCLILHLDHGSHPHSSNRACGFPALGFRSRSCLRSREAALPHLQAFQIVDLPQPLVRELHELPRTSPCASDAATGTAACSRVRRQRRGPDSPLPEAMH